MTYDHKIIVRKFNVSSYVLIYFHHNKKPYFAIKWFHYSMVGFRLSVSLISKGPST